MRKIFLIILFFLTVNSSFSQVTFIKNLENQNVAQEKYDSHLAQQPRKDAYSEEYEFESCYNTWKITLESLGEKVDSLQKSLERDITSTKNSITVTWFCKENGGIV